MFLKQERYDMFFAYLHFLFFLWMFITHGSFVVPFEFLNAIHNFSAEFSRFVPHCCVSVHVFVSQHDDFFV